MIDNDVNRALDQFFSGCRTAAAVLLRRGSR